MSRYKKTILGTGILLAVLILSLLYPQFGPADYNKHILILDKNANFLGKAPFPPSFQHPFGTDENGQDLLLMMIAGVKYTILTAFLVTFLRVIAGGVTGIVLSLWLYKCVSYFKDLFLGFRYVPTLLIAITLMFPAKSPDPHVPMVNTIIYQMFILIIVAFPSVTVSFLEIINDIKQKSFIQTSYLMGANRLHILRRHLLPYLQSYGLFMGVQQFLATLVLIMHLGLFEYFLGGQTIGGTFGYEDPPKAASLSNEWAGLIGQNFRAFAHYPWIVLFVMIGFFFLIGIVNMVKKELEENMKHDYISLKIKKEAKINQENVEKIKIHPSSFVFTKYPHEELLDTTLEDLARKARKRRKIIYSLMSVGAAVSLLFLLHPHKGGEAKKDANVASGKRIRSVPSSTTVVRSDQQQNSNNFLEQKQFLTTFNFKEIANKTEDQVKKLLGNPEQISKGELTFQGNVKTRGVSYTYMDNQVEIVFIEGTAKVMTLYNNINGVCTYTDGLKQCLKGHGLNVDKFDTNGISEAASKIKYANNADGFAIIKIERFTTLTEDVYKITAVTEGKYYPIISFDENIQ